MSWFIYHSWFATYGIHVTDLMTWTRIYVLSETKSKGITLNYVQVGLFRFGVKYEWNVNAEHTITPTEQDVLIWHFICTGLTFVWCWFQTLFYICKYFHWKESALVWLSWKVLLYTCLILCNECMCIFLKLTIIILEYLNGKLCNKYRAKDFPFFDSEAVVWLFFFAIVPHKFITWSKLIGI